MMIPKIITSNLIPLSLSPYTIAYILKCVATKRCFSLLTTDIDLVTIETKSNKIVAKYDTNDYFIICSPEWVQVMHILINLSPGTKKLILRTIRLFPEKMLIIIHLLMCAQEMFPIHDDVLIPYNDISLLLLKSFFNNMGYTYAIHTYIITDDIPEFTLCYSKFCGYEHNPYQMSKYLTNYFDKTHNLNYNKLACEDVIDMGLCNSKWMIDPELMIYLLTKGCDEKHITVGQIYDTKVSISLYMINIDTPHFQPNEPDVRSYLRSLYASGGNFYQHVLTTNNNIVNNIQIHHIIKDNKLC